MSDAQPNIGATALLGDPVFQARAMSGAECAQLAHELATAAGEGIGGTLSLSPAAGQSKVRHPTRFGIAESNHHQVFTDEIYVFDPYYSEQPVLRTSYEAIIREQNDPTVEISYFPASGRQDAEHGHH